MQQNRDLLKRFFCCSNEYLSRKTVEKWQERRFFFALPSTDYRILDEKVPPEACIDITLRQWGLPKLEHITAPQEVKDFEIMRSIMCQRRRTDGEHDLCIEWTTNTKAFFLLMLEYKIDKGDWEAEMPMKSVVRHPVYSFLWLQIWYSIRYCEIAQFRDVNFIKLATTTSE